MNPTSELMTSRLPKVFKMLRKKDRMSQMQVAKKVSITKCGYGHYERGTREVTVKTLRKIAGVFNLTTAQILGIASEIYHEENTSIVEDLKKKLIEKDAELDNLQKLAIKLSTELHG